ncbi:helix-turn-helix domain-containing protein [Mycobacterium sp. TY815]|uniref:helix-turn-helix domain-containing protein n=1 Tax=Mycobacterium sp. TY815 TaxID=3050581 RepID=UPI002742708F|nr:helix-turn-helix domain-containing protein [Mycobacterium sp. TY815]
MRVYRGCTAAWPRRGVIRTTGVAEVLARRRGRRLAGRGLPPPSAFVALELDAEAYAGVPCWSAGPTDWAHLTVAVAYDLHYPTIRPSMCNGGIAKPTLIVIAAAMARYADRSTGRGCRPTNAQLERDTGYDERTIQRAHECLRLLGVATEVLRGRQRTYTERMASWRMGDRHRGWASVWALHDNAHTTRAVTRLVHSLSPHLGRSLLTTEPFCLRKLVTTRAGAHRARHHGATRRRAPDEGGRRLAGRWRADPHAPPWARRFSAGSWAAMLAAPAAAGWTPADLTALVNEWLGTGHCIPDNPARPIALLGSLLAWYTAHNTLSARPAALDEAREAQQRAAAQARARTAARERADYAAARARGKAAATGPGRVAAFAALADAQRAAAARRTATVASSAAASWPPLPQHR